MDGKQQPEPKGKESCVEERREDGKRAAKTEEVEQKVTSKAPEAERASAATVLHSQQMKRPERSGDTLVVNQPGSRQVLSALHQT